MSKPTNFAQWEEENLVSPMVIYLPYDMIVQGTNSRLTTEWGKLETAKKIIESGGWNQTDSVRWRMLSEEDERK